MVLIRQAIYTNGLFGRSRRFLVTVHEWHVEWIVAGRLMLGGLDSDFLV